MSIKIKNLHTSLVDWHNIYRTDFPFRQGRTPYKVWVSEVILQQTKINSSLQKMERFFKMFPDIQRLANASEDSVLKAFEGLGYYNRARNLLKGAKYIISQTKFPDNYTELLKVPSIGPYTAAAIASICFKEQIGVIDGNVKRVYSRLNSDFLPLNNKVFLNNCQKFMRSFIMLSKTEPGFSNEAIMELGQKICISRNPKCEVCPVSKYCMAYKNGLSKELPNLPSSVEKNKIFWDVWIYYNADNQYLMQKYIDFPFLKNQWGFYSIISSGKTAICSHAPIQNQSIRNSEVITLPHVKHNITNFNITFRCFKLKLDTIECDSKEMIWVNYNDVEKYLISSGLAKIWRLSFARGGI